MSAEDELYLRALHSDGRYSVIKKAGSGTFGTVYIASFEDTHVALKCSAIPRGSEHGFPEEHVRERVFLRDCIKSQHIVDLISSLVLHDVACLVMEEMSFSLCSIIRSRKRRMGFGEAKRVMAQISQGIFHMHRLDFIHRDLKPANCLVKNGTVKICDFGAACVAVPGQELCLTVTTIPYCAPEVLLGDAFYGKGVDTWAAGCIHKELRTCLLPFNGTTHIQQIFEIFSWTGTPCDASYPGFTSLPFWSATFPNFKGDRRLRTHSGFRRPSTEEEGILGSLLCVDPRRRFDARQMCEAYCGAAPNVAEEWSVGVPHGWGNQQVVNGRMRTILIDWLIELSCAAKLHPIVWHYTVALVDEFVRYHQMKTSDLQLLGVAATLVATKLFEDCLADVDFLVNACASTFTAAQIADMERRLIAVHIPIETLVFQRVRQRLHPSDGVCAACALVMYGNFRSADFLPASRVVDAVCELVESPDPSRLAPFLPEARDAPLYKGFLRMFGDRDDPLCALLKSCIPRDC